MAENIRNNRSIKGIKIGSKELKLTQLADDTTVFLRTDNDIVQLILEIKRFSKASGLILNTAKTKGLILGNYGRNTRTIHGIDFPKTAIKSLGVYFGKNKRECLQLNWDSLLEDIQNLLNSWKKRNLTYFGKITVIKTLAISKCNHLLQNINTPNEILTKLDRLFFKFLWNDKNDKVKRIQMKQPYENGGLKMVDVKQQLEIFRIKWVNRLITSENASWKIIPSFYFDKYGKEFLIFKMNIGNLRNLQSLDIPVFYQNILETWVTSGGGLQKDPESFLDIRNQILWGNHLIRFRGKCLIYKNWINDKIIYVNDLLNKNGEIDSKLIYNKLSNKQNWISEFSKLRKSIPYQWKLKLKSDLSVKSKIKTFSSFTIQNNINNNTITLQQSSLIDNKEILTYLSSNRKYKPISEKLWEIKFHLVPSKGYWESVYRSIYIDLKSNDLKQFRFRLLNAILPCKENLFKWKITDDPLCEICRIQENYEHLFIDCPVLYTLWAKLNRCFSKCRFDKQMNNLQYLILGYKPGQENYNELNYILSLIGYSIFKAYCISENRKTYVDTMFIVKSELQKATEVVKALNTNTKYDLLLKFYGYFVHGQV